MGVAAQHTHLQGDAVLPLGLVFTPVGEVQHTVTVKHPVVGLSHVPGPRRKGVLPFALHPENEHSNQSLPARDPCGFVWLPTCCSFTCRSSCLPRSCFLWAPSLHCLPRTLDFARMESARNRKLMTISSCYARANEFEWGYFNVSIAAHFFLLKIK